MLTKEDKEEEVKLEERLNNLPREFASGAKRDNDNLKSAIHNLKGYTRLRFGYHMRLGANKYGDANWEKGIPTKSYEESTDRHWAKYLAGDRSEDHLSAMIFNIQGIMLNEQKEGITDDYYFNKLNNEFKGDTEK